MKALATDLNVEQLESKLYDVQQEIANYRVSLDIETSEDEKYKLFLIEKSIMDSYSDLSEYKELKAKGRYTNQD